MFTLFKIKPLSYISIRLNSLNASIDRITVPKNFKNLDVKKFKDLERKKLDQISRGERFVYGNKRILIISSKKKPILNHYFNQKYKLKNHLMLASEGWTKAQKYDNDEITFMPYFLNKSYNNIVKNIKTTKKTSFESLGFDKKICENLKKFFNIEYVNESQAISIPQILSGWNVRCSFETGTGKTIAYLVPLIDKVLKKKKKFSYQTIKDSNKNILQNDENINSKNTSCNNLNNAGENSLQDKINNKSKILIEKKPTILIVVPSRELAYQTYETVKNLVQDLDIGVAPILGGKPVNLKHTGYDIVITTTGMYKKNYKKEMFSIEKIKHLVIDEIDTMCDTSFKPEITSLLNSFSYVTNENLNNCQLILVSATFPNYVHEIVSNYVDLNNISVASSDNVNKILFNIRHNFYRIKKENKTKKLLELCYKFEKSKGQTIIFVNRYKAAFFLNNFLNDNHFDCKSLVKVMQNDKRLFNFMDFKENQFKFLITTDLGSRGLDFSNVQHIINFDCPRFIQDYIHRSGRTGRCNSNYDNCTVETFVCFKPDVILLNDLERSIRTQDPLGNINVDIKKFYKTKYEDLNALKQEQLDVSDNEE